LEAKLGQWNEYEKMKDECLAWIRLTDSKLHSVDLKATLQEKIDQLETLKVIILTHLILISLKIFCISACKEKSEQRNWRWML
jgi:hypothetical protein